MKTAQEIYNQLPSSWNTLRLKDYQAINAIEKEDYGEDTIFYYLSTLCNESVDDLQNLSIPDLTKLFNRIKFITNSVPEIKDKSLLELKPFEDVKYNDFVTYEKLCRNDDTTIQNIHLILKAYIKNDLTLNEILDLNTEEVFTCFFLLQKHTKKFLSSMKLSLRLTLIKQKAMGLIHLNRTKEKL